MPERSQLVLDPRRDLVVGRACDQAVEFYAAATKALVTGLGEPGVTRLELVGMGPVLEMAPGRRLLDEPDHPAEYREFALGRVEKLDVLVKADLDRVMLAPPVALLDDEAEPTGRYRTRRTALLDPVDASLSHAALAVALVDEAEPPRLRGLVAVRP